MKTEDLDEYEKRIAAARKTWPRGPWDAEPNRVEWRAHGLACLIVRSDGTGSLCGYVAVPPGHPAYGQDREAVDVCRGTRHTDKTAKRWTLKRTAA